MTITKDIRYVGVNDHQVDLFEGQYVVPNGMSYNSYVILDEKVAVMDTVDHSAHGAGSFGQHYELPEGLSRGHGGFLRQGLHHDEAVLRRRF